MLLSSIVITYEVPVASPITAPSIRPPEQCRPPPDKTPRYRGSMKFYAGPDNYSEHEVQVSEDQIIRMLRIVHESREGTAP